MYNHRNESISICSPVTVLIEHGASNIRAMSLIPRDHTYDGKMCTLSASDALDKCINVKVHFIACVRACVRPSVRPSTAPSVCVRPLLQVCVCACVHACMHLDGLNAENTFHCWLYSV